MQVMSAYFEITNLCNLNCITCYNRSGLNRCRKELSVAQLSQIIARLSSEFECTTFSFAGGEPLLHSELSELLNYTQSHPEFKFSFVTNGTVHKEAFFHAIQSNPAQYRVQISLDGSSEEINALTRGKGSFSRTIQFIKRLTDFSFRPAIKMVVSQNNLTDIEPFFRLAVDLNCMPVFDFVACNGNASDSWDSINPTPRQKVQVLKLIDRLNKEFPDFQTELPRNNFTCSLTKPNGPVSALIKTDGTIFPCQMLYENVHACGNILTDSTGFIVSKIDELRQLAIIRLTQDYNCKRCPMQHGCARGCFASAYYLTGDSLGDDGNCMTRKLEFFDFDLKAMQQK